MLLKNLQGSNGETDIENRLMGMGRGEERVRLYGKSNIETYFTICKIYSQQEFAIWLSKFKQGLCINLERWDGKGDVRELQNGRDIYVYLWLIHVDI